MKTYDIAIASDDNYAYLLTTSMISCLENNIDSLITIHIFYDKLSDESVKNINKSLEQYKNCRLCFYDTQLYIDKLRSLGLSGWGKENSLSIYSRLYAPHLIDHDIEKILYVDCDTLFCGKIDDLFQTDMSDFVVGGVIDAYQIGHKIKDLQMMRNSPYVNSGVLLIDCNKWRNEGVLNTVIALLKENHYFLPDQDAINVCLDGKIKVLPLKYNIFSRTMKTKRLEYSKYADCFYQNDEIASSCDHPYIIHFAGTNPKRPWDGGLFYRKQWLQYYRKICFKKNIPFIVSHKEIKTFIRRQIYRLKSTLLSHK